MQVILYATVRIFNRGVLVSNSFILPLTGIFILYYFVSHLGNDYYEKKEANIYKISKYTFGIYLYAEPLNYFVLFIFWKLCVIEAFGKESIAIGICFVSLVETTVVAIFMTKILNKLKWNYLL
jgi:hypothetical protein